MTVITQPPENIYECKLLSLLATKSTTSDGLMEKVVQFIKIATPLLDMIIAGPFKEYTLHNRDHAKKVVHLSGQIVNDSVLNRLSALELAVIIFSSFTHDMGMHLTSNEHKRIIQSQDFIDTILDWPELHKELELSRLKLKNIMDETERLTLETHLFQLQETALAAYLRPRHALRETYLTIFDRLKTEAGRKDLFEVSNVSFEDYLIDICMSHNLDIAVLAESNGPYNDRFPRDIIVGGQSLNAQFCATVLRLSDILDFDRERTPHILFESLGISNSNIPGAEVSLKEWSKHLAVHTLDINDGEIIVIADTHHPVIECSVREFCNVIERELRDSMAVLKRNPPNILDIYSFELPTSVRSRIRSIGYVYKDISFKLNQSAILTLLMGEHLYSKRVAALRELIQNAIDACNARALIDRSNYQPSITLRYYTDGYCRKWLEVSDNGIGMDERVLSDYFFQVGSCYYKSPEFHKLTRQSGREKYPAISRFGIGVISTFMIGDILEVNTKNGFSPRGDTKSRRLVVEARGGLAFVTEEPEGLQGTTVRVQLKEDALFKYGESSFWEEVNNYLSKVIVRPMIPINISLPGVEYTLLDENNYYELTENGMEYLSERNLEPIVIQLDRWSEKIKGIAVLIFSIDVNGRLTYLKETQPRKLLRIGKDIEPHLFVTGYTGNRLSVDGFHMKISSITKIFRGKPRIPMVLDVAISNNPDVIYDIPRDRIIGKGIDLVREFIYEAIYSAINELGIIDRLSDETQNYVSKKHIHTNSPIESVEAQVLEQIASMLPETNWTKNIHKDIAEQLGGIDHRIVYQAIRALKKELSQSGG